VAAHLRLAGADGAELRFGEPVLGWEADGSGVRVTTGQGVYAAGSLVACPGAWAPDLLAGLRLPLVVERMVQFWFRPGSGGDGGGGAGGAPQSIYIWETPDRHDDGSKVQFYGFPAHDGPDGGAKVAFFRGGIVCTPDTIDRAVGGLEVERMRAVLASRIPALAGSLLRAKTCMYTTTPDEHFVIARHPEHPQVAIACGFSGHGFKFVPVVGEILADLAMAGRTDHPIGLFDPARFAVRAG
jgi:sarcosine oxidase